MYKIVGEELSRWHSEQPHRQTVGLPLVHRNARRCWRLLRREKSFGVRKHINEFWASERWSSSLVWRAEER